MAHTHDRLYLFGGGRQQYGEGQHPEHRQAVTLVGAELVRLSDQATRANDGAKFIKDSDFHCCSPSASHVEQQLKATPEC